MLTAEQTARPRDLSTPARDRDDGRAARPRGLPALPGGADAADLQRLRDDRGVLEHLPAPVRPARARRLGRAAPAPTTTSRSCRIYEDRQADPADHAAKDGTEVGEVVVRSVKAGYAYVNQPEEQAARFRDGWLYIGDLATWDADEYVTIVGRKDDMIISGGENVHPTQVEAVLAEHPGDRRLRRGRAARRALGRAGRRLRRARRTRRSTPPPARPTATATRCWPPSSARAPTASSTSCR